MKRLGIIVVALLLILGGWALFGRGGSGDSPASVAESMVGSWQSVEDANFVREFKEENVVTDRYGGEEVLSGFWEVFTSRNVPQASNLSFNEETTYMRMSLTGEEIDMIYFEVVRVENGELELIYLDRGGVLEFKKVVAE